MTSDLFEEWLVENSGSLSTITALHSRNAVKPTIGDLIYDGITAET